MLTIKLRLNKDAKGDADRWRLIVDGKEHHVASVLIKNAVVMTIAERQPDGEFKYNVVVEASHWEIQAGHAFIK